MLGRCPPTQRNDGLTGTRSCPLPTRDEYGCTDPVDSPPRGSYRASVFTTAASASGVTEIESMPADARNVANSG